MVLLKWTLLVLMAEKVLLTTWLSMSLTEPDVIKHKQILKMIPFSLAVYVYLACAFRYGSEDLDVIGLSFRRDIWIQRVQVYPATDGNSAKTPMQESLMKKVGEQGCPFSFQVGSISHFLTTQPYFLLRHLKVSHWCDLFQLVSDANKPPMLSLLTAGAKR